MTETICDVSEPVREYDDVDDTPTTYVRPGPIVHSPETLRKITTRSESDEEIEGERIERAWLEKRKRVYLLKAPFSRPRTPTPPPEIKLLECKRCDSVYSVKPGTNLYSHLTNDCTRVSPFYCLQCAEKVELWSELFGCTSCDGSKWRPQTLAEVDTAPKNTCCYRYWSEVFYTRGARTILTPVDDVMKKAIELAKELDEL